MGDKFYSKFEKSPRSNIKEDRLLRSARNDGKGTARNDGKGSARNSSNQTAKSVPLVQKNFSTSQFTLQNSQFKSTLAKDSEYILNNFDEIIQGVRPLNSRQIQQLPENIRNLSHQLTDDRASRRLGYMNDNIQLSSYVRYYTWWNLVRLTRLFANLPDNVLPSHDGVCLDLGTGPLTVVTALWLARPELRKLKLTWYCLDVSANAMALGEDIFLSVAARSNDEPWSIIRVKGPFGTSIKQKADYITCANMFNELDQASDMPPEFQSKKYFEQLQKYATSDANFCLIEPGVPKAARTLSLLRTRFLDAGKNISSPCPHSGDCPMNGFKAYTGSTNKWCNFCFNTEDAPAKLQKLSTLAKLPKERATLSYISVSRDKGDNPPCLCRIVSDPFKLPGNFTGYYACSKFGLTLVRTKGDNFNSGDLLDVKIKTPDSLPQDEKSGAVIINL